MIKKIIDAKNCLKKKKKKPRQTISQTKGKKDKVRNERHYYRKLRNKNYYKQLNANKLDNIRRNGQIPRNMQPTMTES